MKFFAVTAAMLAGVAHADPGYYLVMPYDEAGQTTLETRYWTVTPHGGSEVRWPELALKRGINSRWTTTLLESWKGTAQTGVRKSTLYWQNTVLLTQGEWPVDVAIYAELSHAQDGEFRFGTQWGPLLQTDFGGLRVNLNLIVEKLHGAEDPAPAQLKLQWQAMQHVARGWRLGVQGFGELGAWNHWAAASQQSHRAGPALHWETEDLFGGHGLELQAAWLEGRVNARSARMLSLRAGLRF